jgi:ParB-like chromosome segregation protein Spo0J
MDTAGENVIDVDLHRLQLRFADTRLSERRAIERLARSIERCGQVVPCIAVSSGESQEEQPESWVLIDGYRRVAALKRLGRDTAQIRVWHCDLPEGLLQMLAHAHARLLDPIEEALLLRELVEGLGLTQHEVARRSGRDVSWVNRRLGLLTGVPQECLDAVRTGAISCWAASRVLAPLARANAAHAAALLQAATQDSLSTRDLAQWYAHYQQATRAVRDRMVKQPGLFLKALQAREQERDLEELRAGPEGQCLKDLHAVDAIVARVRNRLSTLSGQDISQELLEVLRRLRARLVSWCEDLGRYDHDQTSNPRCGTNAHSAELQPAGDHKDAQALTEHRPAYREELGAASGNAG